MGTLHHWRQQARPQEDCATCKRPLQLRVVDGSATIPVRVNGTTTIRELFALLAERSDWRPLPSNANVVFRGQLLQPDSTPARMRMRDGDVLEIRRPAS